MRRCVFTVMAIVYIIITIVVGVTFAEPLPESEVYGMNNIKEDTYNHSFFTNTGFVKIDGVFNVTDVNFKYTDYLDVSKCQKIEYNLYYLSNALNIVAFYDDNKSYISGVSHIDGVENGFYHGTINTIPDNAKYVVACLYTGDPSSQYIKLFNEDTGHDDAPDDGTDDGDSEPGTQYVLVTEENFDSAVSEMDGKYERINNILFAENETIIESNKFTNKGYVKPDGSFNASDANFKRTDYIDISSSFKLDYNLYYLQNALCIVAFYDDSKHFIDGISTIDGAQNGMHEGTVSAYPQNAKYAVFTLLASEAANQYVTLHGRTDKLAAYDAKFAEADAKIDEISERVELGLYAVPHELQDAMFTQPMYYKNDVTYNGGTSFISTKQLDIRDYKKIHFTLYQIPDSLNMVTFFDKNRVYISKVNVSDTESGSGKYVEMTVDIPENAMFAVITKVTSGVAGYEVQFVELISVYSAAEACEQVDKASRDVPFKYNHCLNKPFDFERKSAVFFGDSVVLGVGSGEGKPAGWYVDQNWVQRFGAKFHMTVDNRAVSGSDIADPNHDYSILNRILNYTEQKDFIFVGGGINDWYFGQCKVGQLGDTTADTFYGALHLICEKLKNDFPNSTVIFLTIINQCPTNKTNTYDIDEFRNAQFEVATSYGFNVVDCSQIGFPTEDGPFKDLMIYDGIHPTALGHEFMFKSLCGILQ